MNDFFRKSLLCSFVVFLMSCNLKQQHDTFDLDSISEIIENHESTIIFIWASWCGASKTTFNDIVMPFLEDKPSNIGLILIHFGNTNEIPPKVLEETNLINLSSYYGFDKILVNSKFNNYLKGYHRERKMPMTFLVDKRKQILNYTLVENRYLGFGEVLLLIKK